MESLSERLKTLRKAKDSTHAEINGDEKQQLNDLRQEIELKVKSSFRLE